MIPTNLSEIGPLSVLKDPDPADAQFLEDRIDEENVARTGVADACSLAIILREPHGGIMAGLHGWTWGACCEVKLLWVHPQWRKRGLGTRLMIAAETEARARGATQVVLSTHSFQAPDFYRRLGFDSDGRVENYPAGHESIYLRKRLLPAAAHPLF